MRRVLTISILAASFAFTAANVATAADLQVKAPVRPVVLPYNWTGCYLGAHLGYGWAGKHNTDDPSSDFVLGQAVDIDADGIVGGGQIGCNYQITPAVVIGVESDYAGADLKGSATINGPATTVTAYATTSWLATVTGRLGLAFDRLLVYAKGGAAWAGDEYSADWNVLGFAGTVSASETRTGWIFGAGVEYGLAGGWSAKLEYNYMDFGTKAVAFPAAGFGTYIGDIDQTVQVLKVGVNYRFGAAW